MTDAAGLISDVADRVGRRGSVEREWFADWSEEFAAASVGGDEDECQLLLDALVAFDAWQRCQHPNSLRR